MKPIPCMILAGGKSERMGTDKALTDLAGAPLIAHAIGRLAHQVSALAINSNGESALYARFDLPVLADSVAGRPGPLAGILRAMEWAAPQGVSHVMTVATDMPFLPYDLAPRMRMVMRPGRIVVPHSPAGLQPVCALWPVELAGPLRDWLRSGPTRRVRDFMLHHPHDVLTFPPPGPDAPDPFFNANTPEDLALAEAILAPDKSAPEESTAEIAAEAGNSDLDERHDEIGDRDFDESFGDGFGDDFGEGNDLDGEEGFADAPGSPPPSQSGRT
ncbi:molybdenum cofactor guanylyltransferase MobA [Acidimangrovimonas sediminis]|uniref:molybdenum cofactor guanylyltransferase MobA n=1 Tax=Acidimangrovimonas sediminis TaxID=2056283 RepID=UPI000C80FBCD|nr:molybdenum cofactor guanylyltransferase MobA [Acidimangrovimonas sediminis]